ncbi:MAG: hypothetical protein TH68_02305 [Candidatus Synechococcus spongiarum 142]|uniref:Uncharacterized protein n=1 Tax=Candidatus Synechococcus spongiarum 142 TaxID=1608213 RepID=A0A6N3X7T4_9SYNE|nr:MAG: hypothetical protein TH68_02305 [Candidatus Synechococcus spongiarum 142]
MVSGEKKGQEELLEHTRDATEPEVSQSWIMASSANYLMIMSIVCRLISIVPYCSTLFNYSFQDHPVAMAPIVNFIFFIFM